MAKANNLLGWTPRYQPLLLWRWILLTLSLSPAAAWAQSIIYSAPIVITRGGTYTGNYQSLSSGVPCVLVNTNEAVVLDGCNFSGAGNLVQSGTGANLVIRNCRGTALTPSVDNQAPGHFLDSYKSQNLVVEHNYLIGTSGIVVNRWDNNGGAGQTLTVRYNQAKNIDGRWRNAGGSTRSSFLILNTVQHVSGVEVAYNEVINTPDQSLVEDNINLYNASGTSQSPLHFHDNYIRGGYPIPATANNFTGSGMTTDGDATATTDATAYVEADHNQFVSIGNAAMNIAAGHDVYYHDNRAVNSGYLPDGRVFKSGYTGFGVFNYYNQILAVFGNNRIQNNTVGFVRWGSNLPFPNRQDEAVGACAPCNNNTHLPNPITLATEDNEWQLWQQKLQQNGLAVGPINGNTPAPVATVPGAVANPGFEADGAETGTPTGWQKVLAPGTDVHASYTERFGGTHSGSFHGTHYRPEAYEVYTYQVVTGLATGTYTFRAWVRSSGGQAIAQLQAKNYGGAQLSAAIGATNGNNWALVEIANISVSNGSAEIGFYSKATAGQSIYFDDVEFISQASVLNASFEDDQYATQNPVQWTTQTSGSTPASVSYTEAYGGAHSGTYHGTHYRFIGSYTVYTYQVAKNLPAGTYKLTAWVKCSGGQTKVQMQAKNYGGPSLALSIPATPSWQWTQITLTNLAITNGQCEIGFYSNASANQSLYFDDIQLTAIPSAVTNAANSTLALADANDSSVVSLSPNPADNQVNVAMSLSDASNVTLVLTNLQGIEVTRYQRQSVVGDNQFTLDTSNVPSGVYLLQIQSNQPTPVQRLVVTH